MLCVVEPEQLERVLEVCRRWEVKATSIGTVTDSRRLRVFDGDELVGDMPVDVLVDDCPLYDLEPERPSTRVYPDPPRRLADDATAEEALRALLGAPSIADKLWAFEQYDPIVGSRTVRRPAAAGRSPCRSRATAAAWRAIRTRARSRPCSSARAIWRASAPSRSA
jgi:phosphoribosylformylglycinamidine synthase